ncbi:MAG: helix-turn-helix domain-containing protein [Smithella sp.]|jgi:DNA-binding NtrC family response regulator
MSTKKTRNKPTAGGGLQEKCHTAVEEMLEKKLEELATVLSVSDNGKSRLHEEIMAMVEKGLFKIALRRSSNVKSTAAAFLGINRNTFTDKMEKLGINSEKTK